MSGKEKERFVLKSRLLYSKCTSLSQKSAIIDDLMQYVGYESRKHAITGLTQGLHKQKRKKRGHRKILDAEQVDLRREIWVGMGYPCAKLLQPMLQVRVEARKKSQDFSSERCNVKLPKLSVASIDRTLSAFKLNRLKKTDDWLDLERLIQNIHIVNRKEEGIQTGYACPKDLGHVDLQMTN